MIQPFEYDSVFIKNHILPSINKFILCLIFNVKERDHIEVKTI
jgi:hypothetical protein